MAEQIDVERLEDDIGRHYPYPLAATYQRAYYTSPDLDESHDFLLDLFEVTLKYCAAIVLGQYFQDSQHDPQINERLKAIERPSLGHWQGWLRDILTFYRRPGRALLVPELGEFYRHKDTGELLRGYLALRQVMSEHMGADAGGNPGAVTPQQFFELLGAYRNRLAHGARPSRQDRERVAEILLPALRHLLAGLDFLAGYRLVYVNDVRLASGPSPAGRRYDHFYTSLSGDRPRPSREPKTLDGVAADPQQLYLLAKDQPFVPLLSLHPFVIYRHCASCNREQAFVLNSGKERALDYLSYQCTHHFSPAEYLAYTRALLSLLGDDPASEEPSAPEPPGAAHVEPSPSEPPGARREQEEQLRRLDAAMPGQVAVGRPTELWAQICRPKSEGFRALLPQYTQSGEEISREDVREGALAVAFDRDRRSGDLLPARLRVEVNAPDFKLEQTCQDIQLRPLYDSGLLTFNLVPQQARERSIVHVTIKQPAPDGALITLGSAVLYTQIMPTGVPMLAHAARAFIGLTLSSMLLGRTSRPAPAAPAYEPPPPSRQAPNYPTAQPQWSPPPAQPQPYIPAPGAPQYPSSAQPSAAPPSAELAASEQPLPGYPVTPQPSPWGEPAAPPQFSQPFQPAPVQNTPQPMPSPTVPARAAYTPGSDSARQSAGPRNLALLAVVALVVVTVILALIFIPR